MIARLVVAAAIACAACQKPATPAPAPIARSSPPDAAPPDAAPPDAAPPDAAPPDAALPAPDAFVAPDPSRCDRDDDCIVTNFAGCCACPQCSIAEPHAVAKAYEKLDEARCAITDCDGGHCAIAGMCPPGEAASDFAPRCRAHACEMARIHPR